MASVILNSKVLADPRFAALMERLGASRVEAWGLVSLLWLATRNDRLEAVAETELVRLLPFCPNRSFETVAQGLLDAGFLRGGNGAYHVVDNAGFTKAYERRQQRAAKAGLASAAKRAKKKRAPRTPKIAQPAAEPKPQTEAPLNVRAWISYAAAYERRWQVAPVSNATVRGQMAAIVRRIGEDAIGVMAFYVSHNDKFYVLKQHPVGLALKDCESLSTQYKRNQAVTSYDVNQAEKLHAQFQQLEDIRAGKI